MDGFLWSIKCKPKVVTIVVTLTGGVIVVGVVTVMMRWRTESGIVKPLI